MSSEAAIEAFNDAGSANVPLRIRGTDIKFFSGSTEVVRITSNGAIALGPPGSMGSNYARLSIDCHGRDVFSGVTDVTNYGLAFHNDPNTNDANGIGFFNDDGQSCGGYILHQDKGSNNLGDLVFGTAPTANAPAERFRITSNGNIGFNEDQPQHLVHLSRGTSSSLSYKDATLIRINGTNGANVMAGIGWGYNTTDPAASAYPSAWIGAKVSSWTSYVKHDLVFATRGVDTNSEPSERLRVNSTGNVGIGTNVITDVRRLQVHADNSVVKISSTGAAAGHYAQLEFKCGSQDSAWIWNNPPQQSSHGGPGNLAFYQSASGAGYRFYTLGSNTRFDIDSSGNITKPNNPAFGVWKNVSNWNIAANTIFDFDQAQVNRGGHYNTSNYRFTAPVSGIYQVNFHTIIYGANQSNASVAMKVNGSNVSPGGLIHWSTYFSGSVWHNVSFSRVIYLTANDYLEIWNGSVAANYHGGAWCYWSGYLAG